MTLKNKKSHRYHVIMAGLFMLVLGADAARCQNAEFNYNGRVNANGQPFTGTGRFKFAIVNQAGTQTFYANDGVTLNGEEPTTYVTATVTNGFFSVNIGDTTISGMAELDPTIFNAGPVFLRTWFSDGSGFERLTPDRRIVNPSLLGFQSKAALDLYVNSAVGSDSNSGLSPAKAKRTIQSAWNALPALIETTATIHLASGVYREHVEVNGKTPIGHARIILRGNTANPSAVRLTGADAASEATPVREGGLTITSQRALTIEGILFDQQSNHALRLSDGSFAILRKCVFRNLPYLGIYVTRLSQADLTEVECYNVTFSPIWIDMNSIGNINGCYVHDCQGPVSIVNTGAVDIAESRFANMNWAVHGYANALISYNTRTPLNRFENCSIGTRVFTNSTVLNANDWCVYVNTPIKVDVAAGDPVSLF